jgi:bacteriocin-like protein
MHKKNLIPQAITPVNNITIQDLPIELAELSDNDLQQVVGGGKWRPRVPKKRPFL